MSELQGDLTGEFLRRYKLLDSLCKQLYNIPQYGEDGSWDSRSGVVAYANANKTKFPNRTRTMSKLHNLRNDISHETDFDIVVKPGIIRRINEIIEAVQKELSAKEQALSARSEASAEVQGSAKAPAISEINSESKPQAQKPAFIVMKAAEASGYRPNGYNNNKVYTYTPKPKSKELVEFINNNLPHFESRIKELEAKFDSAEDASKEAVLEKINKSYFDPFKMTSSIEHAQNLLKAFDKFVSEKEQQLDKKTEPAAIPAEVSLAEVALSSAAEPAQSSYSPAPVKEQKSAELTAFIEKYLPHFDRRTGELALKLKKANDGDEEFILDKIKSSYLEPFKGADSIEGAMRLLDGFDKFVSKKELRLERVINPVAPPAPAAQDVKSESFATIEGYYGVSEVAATVNRESRGASNDDGDAALQQYIDSRGKLIKRYTQELIETLHQAGVGDGEIKQVKVKADDYYGKLRQAQTKDWAVRIYANFRNYQRDKIAKYVSTSAPANATYNGTAAYYGGSSGGWIGWVIGASIAAALIIAGIVCLIVFRKYISWTGWQFIIGAAGGLVIAAVAGFIAYILDDAVIENYKLLPFVAGAVAIANFVLCCVFRQSYNIIFIFISAYCLIGIGVSAFRAFDDMEDEWGIAHIVEGVVVALLLVVGLSIGWSWGWSWTVWQFIIGAVGGLAIAAVAGFIAYILSEVFYVTDNVYQPIPFIAGVAAIANFVLCCVLRQNYNIIFIFISAYCLIGTCISAFLAFEDADDEWGIAHIVEGIVIAILLAVGLPIAWGWGWTAWQYIIGAAGGLAVSGICVGLIAVLSGIFDLEIFHTAPFIAAVIAIANFVLFLIFRENYKIIFIFLSAYGAIGTGVSAFVAFDDGEAGWGIAHVVEVLAIAALLTVGLIVL